MSRNPMPHRWFNFTPKERPTHWRPKFLCLTCRRCFKRALEGEIETRPCPHCGAVAVRIGVDFRPPKLNDTRAWAVVLYLFRNGVTFRRWNGVLPRTMREARAYVAQKRAAQPSGPQFRAPKGRYF